MVCCATRTEHPSIFMSDSCPQLCPPPTPPCMSHPAALLLLPLLAASAFVLGAFGSLTCSYATISSNEGGYFDPALKIRFGLWTYQSWDVLGPSEGRSMTVRSDCAEYPDDSDADALRTASRAFSVISTIVGGLASFLALYGGYHRRRTKRWGAGTVGTCLALCVCQGLGLLFLTSDTCRDNALLERLVDDVEDMLYLETYFHRTCEPSRGALMVAAATALWALAALVAHWSNVAEPRRRDCARPDDVVSDVGHENPDAESPVKKEGGGDDESIAEDGVASLSAAPGATTADAGEEREATGGGRGEGEESRPLVLDLYPKGEDEAGGAVPDASSEKRRRQERAVSNAGDTEEGGVSPPGGAERPTSPRAPGSNVVGAVDGSPERERKLEEGRATVSGAGNGEEGRAQSEQTTDDPRRRRGAGAGGGEPQVAPPPPDSEGGDGAGSSETDGCVLSDKEEAAAVGGGGALLGEMDETRRIPPVTPDTEGGDDAGAAVFVVDVDVSSGQKMEKEQPASHAGDREEGG